MELTQEQKAIIESTGDIKINAVAGSGKTTTVIEYARTRPTNSKILYLAFNRSVKDEAKKKFIDKGLSNVTVETAHSLAYKKIVMGSHYKVRTQDYKTHELVDILGLQGSGERHLEYIIANHITKFVAYFCNSNATKVQALNYLNVINDTKAKTFVRGFYPYLEKQVRLLLAKMDKGEIEITHDFYLKKFQLSNPQLNCTHILFDEGQDASAAMLDIFLKQPAIKVIVGDAHQQIYGWRYAVNSLAKANFQSFELSTSFRFGNDIAILAMQILDYKNHLQPFKSIQITGKGKATKVVSKAVIARTNLGLLLKAIEYVTEKKDIGSIYFEGNINSYTYADEGASLYDVLSLYNGKKSMIKDKLIGAMKDMEELEEYIEKTDDVQLAMMLDVVNKYGNKIPELIKKLKEKHVDDKAKASIVFSTVHRCKGMEYDSVQLVDDFITEERLIKLLQPTKEDKEKQEPVDNAKLNEEINLLYVAVTRTRNDVHIPEKILPKAFTSSPLVKIIKELVVAKPTKEYTYEYEGTNDYAHAKWSQVQDRKLAMLYTKNVSIDDIAKYMQRTRNGITARIKKLNLSK